MGQQQSKDELVYQQVNYGNIDGIKALRADGAGLEWMDKEGKTPLIVACMNPGLYNVAKTLIELGANINAYRPGRHAGTPLHHAAKRGLDQTVQLLISHGANALVMNDDCQTPLDLARFKGYSNVVRTIEAHICLFSGWLKELHGPSFIQRLAPQFLSGKVWVVILPSGSRNMRTPFKLELAIYINIQDPQPRTVIALWKANMEEPNFNQPEPEVVISDTTTRTRLKLAALSENDKQLLQSFCNACKGIPQVTPPSYPLITVPPVSNASAPSNSENDELAMAIQASLQALTTQEPGSGSDPSSSTANPDQDDQHHSSAIPSAPPIVDDIVDDGPIQYPTIDATSLDLSVPSPLNAKRVEFKDDDGSSSTCVICLDAPVEGACIPCGHMAGCMSCLNEIQAKKWGCPVCRAKINQVLRIYSV